MKVILTSAALAAFLLIGGQPAFGAQLSVEDQYVDGGPTGNGPDGAAVPGDPVAGGSPASPAPTTLAPAVAIPRGASTSTGDMRKDEARDQEATPTASAAGPGEGGGGSLPLVGYPLTPLVGLVLGFVAVAVAVRIVNSLAVSRLRQEA